MKTTHYNPSPLEVEFAKAINDLQSEIAAKIKGIKIDHVETAYTRDNPHITFKFRDADDHHHEIMVKFIERVLD